MIQASKFTIRHGIAASLVVHFALALPFALSVLEPPADEPPVLVIDLQGIISDQQIERKVMQETAALPPETTAPPSPPLSPNEKSPDDPPKDIAEASDAPVPPAPSAPAPAAAHPEDAGSKSEKGADEQQVAQTIRPDRDEDRDRLNAYIKSLGRKIRAHLVYPADGRRAAATVSFAILRDGQLRPGSLKIVESTGQPALDASALKTIRASVPFEAPPQEMTIAITVDFDRKR